MSPELVSALVAALIGGVVGSTITAWASVAISKSHRREAAATALWNYQYALSAFAAKEMSEVLDDQVSIISADFKHVRDGLRDAYPYAGYLPASARKQLFRAVWIDVGPSRGMDLQDALDTASEFDKLAELLEMYLDGVFPRRFGDRFRSLWHRRLRKG